MVKMVHMRETLRVGRWLLRVRRSRLVLVLVGIWVLVLVLMWKAMRRPKAGRTASSTRPRILRVLGMRVGMSVRRRKRSRNIALRKRHVALVRGCTQLILTRHGR